MKPPHVLVAIVLASTPSVAFAYGESDANGFPNWGERVILEWANRARAEPQIEMAACGASCPEGSCYMPVAPASYDVALGRAARFHSDEMAHQSYFNHDSACTVVDNIDDIYPQSCDGSASCACVGGAGGCNPSCTSWSARVGLFGASASGEIIASGTDPDGAFYQWLFEAYDKTTCGYDQGPPTNGHRYNLLMAGPAMGAGIGAGPSVGDFGGTPTSYPIPSAAHYPRQAATVDAWANWYGEQGPSQALVDVDGSCTPMVLERGVPENGAYHVPVTGVGSGCHRYFFVFKDAAGAVVTYPTEGSLGIGPEGSCADWDATRPALGAGCDCTPSCDGAVCGDDGCGGSCGPCGDEEACVVGQWVAGAGGAGAGGGAAEGGGSSGVGASAQGGAGDGASDGGLEGSCSCREGRSERGPYWISMGLAIGLGGMRRRLRTVSS